MKGPQQWTRRCFRAEGLCLEKMIVLCGSKGIPLTKVKRKNLKCLEGQVSDGDFENLCVLAEERGWKITPLGYVGWGMLWEKSKARKGLWIGLILMMALIMTAMQFVWRVEIIDAGVYEGDLRASLIQKGIGTGTLKKTVDLQKLRNELEWRYPKVAWVHTALRGSTLVIRLVEGVPSPEVAPYGEPGDVIAQRGGVVISVEPQSGTALVKAGDIVKTGQVLIRGAEKRGEDAQVHVKARGRVLARVWDRAIARIPLYETVAEPTGERTVIQSVETPWGAWLFGHAPTYGAQETLIETWPLPGVWWPVTLKRETISEVTLLKVRRSAESAEAEARQAAMLLLKEKTGDHDEAVDKWIDYCMIESGTVVACATGERIRDIAVSAPSTAP